MKPTRNLLALAALFGAAAPGALPAQPADDVVTLETFTVTDRQDAAYKSATAITGTKTDTPLIQVPQAIQVITKDVIADLGAVEITDLYPLMGSVTEFSYGGVSFRGFRQEQTRYNGISGSPYNDFGILTLNNVQQVEVLKGPVGLLYGDNEPGGMINIVTAKPQAEVGGSVSAQIGSENLRGGSVQLTGPIDARKKLLYLVNATYTERDTFRDNHHQEALNLTGALTWVITPATRLTAEIEHIRNDQDGARLRGVPYLATGFLGSIRFNAAEPTDFQNLDTTVYNLQFDHAFSSSLRLNAYVRYFESEATQQYHEPNNLLADQRTWTREFRHQLRENEDASAALNLIGDYEFLGAKHKILTGAEYSKVNRVFTSRTVSQNIVRSIDVINPVYGLSSGSMYDISLAGIVPNDTDKTRIGYYLQDQINLRDRWHLLAGLRYEYFDDVRRRPTYDQFDDAVFTYRTGAVYMIRPNLAAYVSYAMGLKPQTLGSEDQNGPFPPQESSSWEGGFKLDLFGNRLGLTASVYDIVKTNILERDPTPGAPSNWLVPIGEIQSRGFEFDATGQLTADWSITANYAYNDAMVSKSVLASTPVGSRFPNAPRHKAGLWTRYNLPRYNLGFGFGVSHVGERPNFAGATNFPGPAYTLYNAALYYRWEKVQFSFRADNLFDKVYAKSVFTTDGHFPGAPRTLTLSAIYRF